MSLAERLALPLEERIEDLSPRRVGQGPEYRIIRHASMLGD
jgi:hypothetical protein